MLKAWGWSKHTQISGKIDLRALCGPSEGLALSGCEFVGLVTHVDRVHHIPIHLSAHVKG